MRRVWGGGASVSGAREDKRIYANFPSPPLPHRYPYLRASIMSSLPSACPPRTYHVPEHLSRVCADGLGVQPRKHRLHVRYKRLRVLCGLFRVQGAEGEVQRGGTGKKKGSNVNAA